MKIKLLITLSVAAIALTSYGGSATWNLNPSTGNWNNAANWTPATVPNGPTDIATFSLSNAPAVSLSATTEVNTIVFSAGASPFTISNSVLTLTISGAGITNNSGTTQNFVSEVSATGGFGYINFTNSATAGEGSHFTVSGATAISIGALLQFLDSSSAGHSTIDNNGGTITGSGGGILLFLDSSSAGNSVIMNNSASVISGFMTEGGQMEFDGNATAADSIITNNGGTNSSQDGGQLQFRGAASAGNAVLIANGGVNGGGGGTIWLLDATTAESAQVQVFGNGTCDVGAHDAPGMTVGSIEGSGALFLGGKNLQVGSNNRSTTISGVIQAGGLNKGTDGSLTKVGTGSLTLSGLNTYKGGTTVSAGTLLVATTAGSGTGRGAVQVDAGTLGGRGIISGRVTVGSGTGLGAFLSPSAGASTPAILTLQTSLTFKADGTYTYKLNTKKAQADQVIANGVTIETGAQFDFQAVANKRLTIGAVFVAISNTSASPISGTFANLVDGSTFTAGRNKFQVSYSGGDGNDLTLTVVP